MAPAGTPPAIIKKLQAETAKAVKSPLMQKLGERGMAMIGNTSEEFDAFIIAERKKWGETIKGAGIEAR